MGRDIDSLLNFFMNNKQKAYLKAKQHEQSKLSKELIQNFLSAGSHSDVSRKTWICHAEWFAGKRSAVTQNIPPSSFFTWAFIAELDVV